MIVYLHNEEISKIAESGIKVKHINCFQVRIQHCILIDRHQEFKRHTQKLLPFIWRKEFEQPLEFIQSFRHFHQMLLEYVRLTSQILDRMYSIVEH